MDFYDGLTGREEQMKLSHHLSFLPDKLLPNVLHQYTFLYMYSRTLVPFLFITIWFCFCRTKRKVPLQKQELTTYQMKY